MIQLSWFFKQGLVEAVLYIVKTGCQWRMLPHDYPPHDTTVWSFYRRAGDHVLRQAEMSRHSQSASIPLRSISADWLLEKLDKLRYLLYTVKKLSGCFSSRSQYRFLSLLLNLQRFFRRVKLSLFCWVTAYHLQITIPDTEFYRLMFLFWDYCLKYKKVRSVKSQPIES